MNHKHTHTNGTYTCSIVPPYILESIAINGTPAQRAAALRSLGIDAQIREQRAALPQVPREVVQEVGSPRKNRLIYTANHTDTLPGTLVRSEGEGPSGDIAVDEAYDALGTTFDFYFDIYGRNSINNNGMDMIASVHWRDKENNAIWTGSQMAFGDGDGVFFNRFTSAIDVTGHEMTHGVIQFTAYLVYKYQSGALNESISDVFGSLVKQRSLGQTAAQADWLIGAGLFTANVNGVALRSMKAPGTAFDDPILGKDPQPNHMSRYVNTEDDNGGVHINSGIPNKAFYLAATAIGGNAWEVAGNIWYRTLLDSRLSSTAQFQDFAILTIDNACRLYGSAVKAAVSQAWSEVGIELCQAETNRVKAAQFKIDNIKSLIENLQDLLKEASPSDKGKIIKQINEQKNEMRTISNGELADAKTALQSCRTHCSAE
jgi:Zn-dependent metalloprotease